MRNLRWLGICVLSLFALARDLLAMSWYGMDNTALPCPTYPTRSEDGMSRFIIYEADGLIVVDEQFEDYDRQWIEGTPDQLRWFAEQIENGAMSDNADLREIARAISDYLPPPCPPAPMRTEP